MKQLATISLFLLSTFCALSQPSIDIYFITQPYPSKGSVIESIEENYELMIPKIPPGPFKITKFFDKTGNILVETKYNKTGSKQNETKWEYNKNQKLTKKTHRYFVNMLGWKTEETTLSYNDTSGYISEIRYAKNGILQSMSKVFCDSLGKPVEVRVLNEKGAFSMIERISYSPNANIIRVMLLKPTNQLISLWTYPIDLKKTYQTGKIEKHYYPSGEVMLESLEDKTKLDQGYYYEYSYDSQGNWVEKNTYQVTLGRNNKMKDKKLEHRILRTIKYY